MPSAPGEQIEEAAGQPDAGAESSRSQEDDGAQAEASKPSATPDQRRAIDARGVDVVVAAGAGSGKTYVLVERFMGLVRDGAHPERLLTITFTEKAAREMSERIGNALEGEGYPDARRVIEAAWIGTIHGFCARLLRERALEAGVDPAFSVLTEVPAARFRRQAFLAAQRSFRAAHPGLYDGLIERVRWGKGRDGATQIRRHVFGLHDELRAAGARLRSLPARGVELDGLATEAVVEALAALSEANQALQSAGVGAKLGRRLGERLSAISARVGRLIAEADSIAREGFRLEVHRELRGLVELARGGGALAVEMGDLLAAAEGAARAYAEGPSAALGRALEDLLLRFDQAFRSLKAEHSALDFTDLEERTRDLLERRADVREATQRRFESILVDEFQDTSRLQQRIVDLVRSPEALFAVGDVKQSIYGFRHAEVRGLLETTSAVEEAGGEVVDLDRSFRTRPEILSYVDAVFSRAWSEPGSEVPHQPLVAGVEFPAAPRPCVELVLARGERLPAARVQEARAVAARLATLVEERQLVGTNPLRADRFGQVLGYGDCAILLPTTTQLHLYEQALRARGVPYRVASGRGFYQAREVIDAVNLLKVCADAGDDLALLAMLRSPAVGLGDDTLAALGELRPERGSLFGALELAAGGALSGIPGKRAVRALGLVRGLRAWRGRRSVSEILARGLSESGLLDGSLLRGGDVRGYANLQKLLEVVAGLEAEGVSGPGAVAAVLDDLRQSEARESEANVSSDDEDAVSVLTVHGSKGLEWPVVVVGDCGRYAPRDDDPVAWCAAAGVSVVLRDPDDERAAVTPATLARLCEEGRARRREESKRLLYVAMTRARDHLILAGAQRSGARTAGDWLTWARAAVRFDTAHLGVEQDVAAGGLAKGYPTAGGAGEPVVVRSLEVAEEQEGEPLAGVRGPAADAVPVLDARGCEDLAHGRIPRLPEADEALQARAQGLIEAAEAEHERHPMDAATYTVSEVLTWRRCPRRALYEHVLRDERSWGELRPEPGWEREGRAAGLLAPDLRGTLAHEVLAQALTSGVPRAPRVEARAAQLLLPDVDARACAETARWAIELSERFLLGELARRAGAQADTAVERPFLVELPLDPPVLLSGTVDLVLRGPGGGWVLVDYKASDVTALELPQRVEEHSLQLVLYALALAEAGWEVEAAYLAYLVPDVIEPVDVGPSSLERARELLEDFARARSELDLPPRPGSACRWCPWQQVCPDADTAVLP